MTFQKETGDYKIGDWVVFTSDLINNRPLDIYQVVSDYDSWGKLKVVRLGRTDLFSTIEATNCHLTSAKKVNVSRFRETMEVYRAAYSNVIPSDLKYTDTGIDFEAVNC